MDVYQIPILMIAPPVLLAYVCRLAMLSFRGNSPAVVLLHMSLAVSVAWAAYHAALGVASLGDIAAVIGAACWIRISYKSWRFGVPEHFASKPTELHPAEFPKVHGGKK